MHPLWDATKNWEPVAWPVHFNSCTPSGVQPDLDNPNSVAQIFQFIFLSIPILFHHYWCEPLIIFMYT